MATPNTTVWFHIVFNFLGTRNDQGVRVYIDGALAGTDSGPMSMALFTVMQGQIALGQIGEVRAVGESNRFSSIQVDEMLIFNRALTAAEIAILSQPST